MLELQRSSTLCEIDIQQIWRLYALTYHRYVVVQTVSTDTWFGKNYTFEATYDCFNSALGGAEADRRAILNSHGDKRYLAQLFEYPCYILSTKRGNIKEMTAKLRLINDEVIDAINASTERNANFQYQDPFTGAYYACSSDYSFRWVNGKAEHGRWLSER